MTKQRINSLCNSVIIITNKFIHKCETGKARSVETLSDLTKLKNEAEMLKDFINKKHIKLTKR
jgi:hypothetical protein